MQNDFVIRTEEELRRLIPRPPKPVSMKILPQIEANGRRFIGLSTLVALTTVDADGRVRMSARGGAPGFARVLDDGVVLVPDAAPCRIGEVLDAIPARPFAGLIFLVPGFSETLRVNGRARIESAAGPSLRLEVEEALLHCPKAFVRSSLWNGAAGTSPSAVEGGLPPTKRTDRVEAQDRAFIEKAPFLFLGTSQGAGHADVSPRGDRSGCFARVLDEHTLLVPDRPGNRLLDNFLNILAHPFAALLFLLPGSNQVVRVRGRAQLVRDPALLAPLAVDGKTPQVGVRLEIEEVVSETAPALAEIGLWDRATYQDRSTFPTMGEMLVDQMNPRGWLKGTKAKVLDAMVRRDVKTNLY